MGWQVVLSTPARDKQEERIEPLFEHTTNQQCQENDQCKANHQEQYEDNLVMQISFCAQFQDHPLHEGEQEHVYCKEEEGIRFVFFEVFKYEAILVVIKQIEYGDQEEDDDRHADFE